MTNKNQAGLFREDLKTARVIKKGEKFAIEAEYNDETKEELKQSFDSFEEAQREIKKTLTAKN